MGDSPLELTVLLSLTVQLAIGMQCLAAHGITHRALACKNVLVFRGRVLKLGKLWRLTELVTGLTLDDVSPNGPGTVSRSVVTTHASNLGIPLELLRWMVGWGWCWGKRRWAVGSDSFTPFAGAGGLSTGVYQSSADVWSWAVCAWKILTLGEEPYGDMSGDDVLDLLQNGGSRLAQPINCPDAVYEVLQRCWSLEPRQRPDFPSPAAHLGLAGRQPGDTGRGAGDLEQGLGDGG